MRSIPVLLLALTAGACASKGFVNRNVGQINDKVEGVSAEVEQTQERVKKNETRIASVDQRANDAMSAAQEAQKAAKGKLIYQVTLSNDKVTFPKNRATISDEAKQLIDEAVDQLKTENKGVFFEIAGHTDATGPEELNRRLGEERAEAVRDYLHDQHGIALNRMAVISYGETRPVVDNKTADNRAQNRRVVISVLE
jgi:outer membrane protein OmpA-like peptidoglycan-associated protein